MIIFSKDTEIARSIPLARVASYSTSLLDAGKSNSIARSILSPVGAFSYRPTLASVCQDAPSTQRTNQSAFPGSVSCNICPFITKRGLYWMSNSLSSIAHRAILHNKSSLCMVLCRRRMVSTIIGCAWK